MTFSEPSAVESQIVGIIGVLLYGFIFVVSVVNLWRSEKLMPRYFFLAMTLMSTLELPRYIVMVIFRSYTSTLAYSCHIIASYLYFLCVSLVCLMWCWLLELGVYTNVLYSKSGLLLANVALGLSAIIACSFCIVSPNLTTFFRSPVDIVYMSMEAVAIVFYTTVISMYGLRLMMRFRSYMHDRSHNNKPALTFFNNALTKVTFMLITSCLCAIARLSLLLLKLLTFHSSLAIRSDVFPQYGVLWFCWSDFIPRVLGSIALLNIVIVKAPAVTHTNGDVLKDNTLTLDAGSPVRSRAADGWVSTNNPIVNSPSGMGRASRNTSVCSGRTAALDEDRERGADSICSSVPPQITRSVNLFAAFYNNMAAEEEEIAARNRSLSGTSSCFD